VHLCEFRAHKITLNHNNDGGDKRYGIMLIGAP